MKMMIALALLIFGLFNTLAYAQVENRTFQNSLGQNIGRSVTDTRGNTLYYDRMGQNTGRSVTSNSGTMFYDRMGRQTGSVRR